MMTSTAMESGAIQASRRGLRAWGREVVRGRLALPEDAEREAAARGAVHPRLLAVAPCRDVGLDAMSTGVLCEGQRCRER